MKAIHFGAGNIGRGFIGLLLSRAGYKITFVDVNPVVVEQLRERGEYTVSLAEAECRQEHVKGVTAVLGDNLTDVAQEIVEADLVTTAVGVMVLPHIAPAIAAGIEQRAQSNPRPMQIIACENTIGGSSQLKRYVYEKLSDAGRRFADQNIVFPDAAVDRIVPLQQHTDPLYVTVEPFYEWVVARTGGEQQFEEIPGVHYVDSLEPYIARKLFTVNTGHCCAAYFGYLSGYTTIQQVMGDPSACSAIRGVLRETGAYITSKYGFDTQEHNRYIGKILERFSNPFLTDDIARVGRSPLRKLSPKDRLVMPAVEAYEMGLPVEYLAQAIAAALQFNLPDDPEAVQLQQVIHDEGVGAAIARFTGLEENHPLHVKIKGYYQSSKPAINSQNIQIFSGVAASPGIAISKVYKIEQEQYIPEQQTLNDPTAERERFLQAVEKARHDLEGIRSDTLLRLGQEKAEIFEGHIFLLKDPEYVDVIAEKILVDQVSAEYALHEITQMFIDLFKSMDSELMRARAVDIGDVGARVMSHLRGVQHADLSQLTEECILLAEDLTPSDTARLNLAAVQAFVTIVGSRTSHSAIMARSLELPAVVGVDRQLLDVVNGTRIIVDAVNGVVIINPDEGQVQEFTRKKRQLEESKKELQKLISKPTMTLDGHHLELAANIGSVQDLEKVLENGAEGIGLFRTEFLYMDRGQAPSEEEQFGIYRHILEKMGGKPVVIRTLDIGGDKQLDYMELPVESNPFLGLRAVRLCLQRQEIFRTQLRALLRASIYGNLKVMFPMIALLSEWQAAKQILIEEKGRLLELGIPVAEDLEVGMMVEIPAAAVMADVFAKEVDFFSIGTNDLIQYTMAADRMNEAVAYLYQPCNPVILRLIDQVVQAATREGKWVGMCGEMAGDPRSIPLLVGLGLQELSMSAGSILPARGLISSLEKSQWSALAQDVLKLGSEEQVLEYIHTYKKQEERAG